MNIAVRVDASPAMGTGHFARCLALAELLIAQGATVRFISRSAPPHLRGAVATIGAEWHELPAAAQFSDRRLAHASWLGVTQAFDAAATAAALSDRPVDWLIADHYALDAEWEAAVRARAPKIAVIDDLADRAHDCDLLLDQNLHEDPATRYRGLVPDGCRQLLGPAYALLRAEFAQARPLAPRRGDVRRVLVFFGGVDSANHTAMAVQALAPLRARVGVDVVIGAGHAHRYDLERVCAENGFALHVQAGNIAQLAAAADLAVGVGGVALWERCCVGLPAIAFVSAANHAEQVACAADAGIVYAPSPSTPSVAAIDLHTRALLDAPALRRLLSSRALSTVDGRGAARVVRALLGESVAVRPVTEADSDRVLGWRNHESVRLVSRHADPIDRQQHARWFEAVRSDPSRPMLIGEIEGAPIGVVRFDIAEATAEVSIYLAPERQGTGAGPALLAAAERWLRQHRPTVQALVAEVAGGNARSERLFTGGGYVREHTGFIKQVTKAS